jgi:hypothetical protein
MKKMKVKTAYSLLLVFTSMFLLNACGSQSGESQTAQSDEPATEEVSEQTKASLEGVANFEANLAAVNTSLDAYMLLKDALVATKADMAQKAADKLATLSEAEVKTAAEGIASSSDIKEQRSFFNTISQQMYETLKAEGAGNTVYKQYCPMAFNNEGAYWLSSEEKIMNPYFGDMMLNCGRVDETLQATAN